MKGSYSCVALLLTWSPGGVESVDSWRTLPIHGVRIR